MPDTTEIIRSGEQRPFYGSATAESGNLTIQGTSTATLYDGSSGLILDDFDGIPVTGQVAGPASEVSAWLLLDSDSLEVWGQYDLVFSIRATGSDGMVREFQPAIRIVVKPPEG